MDEEQSKESKEFVVTLPSGVKVDLTNIGSFTLGDKKKLKKDYGLDFSKGVGLDNTTPDQDASLVLFILRKVNSKVEMDDVDELPLSVGNKIIVHAVRRSQEVGDGPFLKHSTSSPANMDGPKPS